MGKWEKLIEKVTKLDKSVRFDELKKILESIGYICTAPKGGSSHFTFRKAGKMPITLPKKSPMNKVYIQMVRDAILEEEDL